MSTSLSARQRGRRIVIFGAVGIGIALIAFSSSFGRATPTGSYRPDLPPAALSTGCWPLPSGVRFDFAYQVRVDGDIGDAGQERRRLVMQFDLIDVATARERVTRAFIAAGFDRGSVGSGEALAFHKPGVGQVAVKLSALPGTTGDSIVRGTIVLDLPSTRVQSNDPVCSQPFATKRFPPGNPT